MSNKPTVTTATFKPEAPLKPAAYVDQLIKIVQKMAPHASRTQWNRFGIAARNIELSHEFHMGAIAHASTTSVKPIAVEDLTEEFVEARLKSCQKELEFLAQMMRAKAQESADLQTLLQHFDEFGASTTATSSSIVSKNSGI